MQDQDQEEKATKVYELNTIGYEIQRGERNTINAELYLEISARIRLDMLQEDFGIGDAILGRQV
jgi:hypothetical protein